MPSARKYEAEREVTARPRSIDEELYSPLPTEQGLSVDPEDLGVQFVNSATEQGNFESSQERGREMRIVEGSPTDGALPGPNFEPDQELWATTVDMALQNGDLDDVRTAALPNEEASEGREHDVEESREVDVTSDVLREASLFDREADELGEVESAEPHTDESKRRTARKERRNRPQA